MYLFLIQEKAVAKDYLERCGGSDAVADLNPDDIASISMMTGPSAAALYGSAAANGVVLITTKKGKTEKTTITVSNSTTFSKAYIMPDMQNRYGTSSGLFSWGELTNRRYNPSDFFETGSNVINSVALIYRKYQKPDLSFCFYN